jgi:hypothetical protein
MSTFCFVGQSGRGLRLHDLPLKRLCQKKRFTDITLNQSWGYAIKPIHKQVTYSVDRVCSAARRSNFNDCYVLALSATSAGARQWPRQSRFDDPDCDDHNV